jgi:hypothetical protein
MVTKSVQLKVVGHYRAGEIEHLEGQILDLTEEAAEFLLRDSPSCFEVVAGEDTGEESSDETDVRTNTLAGVDDGDEDEGEAEAAQRDDEDGDTSDDEAKTDDTEE